MILALFTLVVLLAFIFGLTNGFIDGGSLVSTVITTRTLEPLPALLIVAVCEMLGPFFFGHAVIDTLGNHLVRFPSITPAAERLGLVGAALLAALLWNTSMWRLALPSSSSHALVGGLVGAFVGHYGWQAVQWTVFIRVFILLGLIPLAGSGLGWLFARLSYWSGEFLTPSMRPIFRGLQIVALGGTALVHGSNDAQKSAGMIVLALVSLVPSAAVHVPASVLFLCGFALALGVIFGSRRMIGTLGKGLARIEPLQGFCAQTAAMVLVGASCVGGYPMSTTHVMSTSILGSGMAIHPRYIRWGLAREMGIAWLVTIPASGLFAALLVVGWKGIRHVVS